MTRIPSRFLNSTGLVSVPPREPADYRRYQQESRGILIENCSVSNCRGGILQIKRLQAPPINQSIARMIESEQPEYLTRHIESKWFSSALMGAFHFGTLMNYRASEGVSAGRLGDHQESRIQEIFNTRSGIFEHAQFDGIEIKNSNFDVTENQVVVETVVNDYCSCSSIGKFSRVRGEILRERESVQERKPGAFVTYHLPTLRNALNRHLSEHSRLSRMILVGRNVSYGQKDRRWDVEERFSYQQDRDSLAIWLSIAFVKSPLFAHEEEYRLLLVDPSGPGGLHDHVETYRIAESRFIASAIVASGTF